MKRGLAVMTIAALLGVSAPVAYASTISSAATVANVASPSSVWTVKSGDTLWKISQNTGVPVPLIEQYNNITNVNAIQVGQVLKIPSIWTVKSGDTLWSISLATGASIANIEQANPSLNPSNLAVGMMLIIPPSAVTTASSAGTTSSSTPAGNTTSSASTSYTVQSGDTLWAISQKTGVSVANIEQANSSVNPSNLSIGTVLVIPSTSNAGTSSSTSTGTNSSTTGAASTAGNTGSTGSTTYIVKSGDTFWSISQAMGVSVANIEQANPNINLSNLAVGMTLVIPSVSATTTKSSSTGSTSTTASVSSVAFTAASANGTGNVTTSVNTAVPITVTAKDAQGNTINVPQSSITYSITGTNEVSNPANAQIDAASQQFTATQPGSYACVATVDGVQSQPLDVDVIGPPTNISVGVNPDLVTGSNTLVPVNIVVGDAVGQSLAPTTPVTITVDNSSIAGISLTNVGPISKPPSTVTTTVGHQTVWLQAGSVSGSANLIVTCGSVTKTIPIQSISGPTKLVATVSNPTVAANTKFSDVVTVQAYNADGSPAAGVPLSTDYSTGLFKVLSNTVTTNSQGIAQYTLYENNTSTGTSMVGARTGLVADLAPVAVVPGLDAAESAATLPGSLTLGVSYVVPVTVKDASGNPVLHLDQAAFDLHLQGQSGVYDSQGDVTEIGNGQYQVTFFTPGNTDTSNVTSMRNGNYLATMLVNGIQVSAAQAVNITSASYQAQTEPNSAPNISLTFPQHLIVGNQSTDRVKVQVTDANGNPVANQTVTLSSNNTNIATFPGLAYPYSDVTTDANGVVYADIKAGFMTGTTAITAVSGTSTQTLNVQSVNEPASITLSAPTTTVVSNGSVTVTAKVLNADGSPASNIELDIYSGDGSDMGPMDPNFAMTDANGVATFQVTPADFTSGNTLNVQLTDHDSLQSNTLTFTLN